MKSKLLENLNQELGSQVSIRRYSLADMISESYKVLYKCDEGSNLRKLAESHLNDLKENPRDISRLSRQLGIVKELVHLKESGELKDEDLVEEKYHDQVEPQEERVLIKEDKDTRVYIDDTGVMGEKGTEWTVSDLKSYWDSNKDSDPSLVDYSSYEKWCRDTLSHMKSKEVLDEAKEEYVWGNWQIERGNPSKVKYYTAGKDILNKIIGVVYAPSNNSFRYGAEIYNNETAETVIGYVEFDDEDTAVRWVEDKLSHQTPRVEEPTKVEDTPAEEAPVEDTPVVEEPTPEDIKDSVEIHEAEEPEPEDLTDEELEELAKHLETIRKERKTTKMTETEEVVTESEEVEEAKTEGSKIKVDIYVDGEFDRSKYFNDMKDARKWVDQFNYDADGDDVATDPEVVKESVYEGLENFKKQSESKAFYKTFKRMNDVLKEGKELSRQESIDLYKASNSALTQLSIELEHNPDFLETFKESVSVLSKDVNSLLESLTTGEAPSVDTVKSLAKFSEALLTEAEYEDDEEFPVEETPEDFVGDDEGDIEHEPSAEEEKFDQEYADGREELHNELADEFEETEDEIVQDKLEADRQEVAELLGEDPEEVADEETPVDDFEDEVVDDITDDELEELKKHLREMRAAKKSE